MPCPRECCTCWLGFQPSSARSWPIMPVHARSFHALLNTAQAGWASTPLVPLQSAGRPAPPRGSRWAPCLCRMPLTRHPEGMCWQPPGGPFQLQQQTRRVVLCRAMNVMTWKVTASRCMSTRTQVPHATDTSPWGMCWPPLICPSQLWQQTQQ
jgi:hypothetical protein